MEGAGGCTCHAHIHQHNNSLSSYKLFLFVPRCNRLHDSKQHTSNMKRKSIKKLVRGDWLWHLLYLIPLVTGIQVPVSRPEGSPVPSTAKSSPSTLLLPSATEASVSDGADAVGEAPDVTPTASAIIGQLSKDIDEGLLLNSIPSSAGTPFPENHKNSSGEAPSLELPPYLQEYNKYQQQYKDYIAQKNQYAATAKPFKFDDFDNPQKTRYLTEGLSAYGDESPTAASQTEAATAESLPRYKPFPYFYQNENSELDPPETSAYPLPDDNLLNGPSADEDTNTEAPSFFPNFVPPPWANFFNQQPPKEHKQLEAHRSEVSHKPKSPPAWKKIVKVISTVLPLGLFLATLTPNLIYINSTAEDNKPSRLRSQPKSEIRNKRDDDAADPLTMLVQKFGGLEAMEDPECEDRFFCEMSVLGHKSESNLVEKGLWYIANETPDHIAEEVGMKELFAAIKNKSCEIYKCKGKPAEAKSEDVKDTTRAEIPVKLVDRKQEKKTRKVKKFTRMP